MGFHDREAREVFAGDQFDILLLALAFAFDHFSDLRIDHSQAQLGRHVAGLHLAHSPLVTTAFETRVQESIDNLLGIFRRGPLSRQAKDVGVVMLSAIARGSFIIA